MYRVLVVPNEFIDILKKAEQDSSVLECWKSIGVSNHTELLQKMIFDLNRKFPKLNIKNYREEFKTDIKDKLNNTGSVSKYLGYIEREPGCIDGLFFYNDPSADNANDIATRNVWASLIGLYGYYGYISNDRHFLNRPVYLVNLNETKRLKQNSVKTNIICNVLSGINYLDMFNNDVIDIITDDSDYSNDDIPRLVNTIEIYDRLMAGDSVNNYFKVNFNERSVTLLPDRIVKSKNPAAEVYRVCPKIVGLSYLMVKEGYSLDISLYDEIDNKNINILKTYLRKLFQ